MAIRAWTFLISVLHTPSSFSRRPPSGFSICLLRSGPGPGPNVPVSCTRYRKQNGVFLGSAAPCVQSLMVTQTIMKVWLLNWFWNFWATVFICSACLSAQAEPPSLPDFIQQHRIDCHSGETPEAGLDLEQLLLRLPVAASLETWVKVHDWLQAGEMPPGDMRQPTVSEREGLLASLAKSLRGQLKS